MRKLVLLSFCFLSLSIIFSSPGLVFAAIVEFSGTQSSFQKEQEAVIDVKISGAAANTLNYLRAAFYPDSTTSYFGYTFNHLSEWYNGASPIDPKKFLQIQISGEGTWSGQLKIKPDISSTYFKGNGSYLLKVGRYTANGTSVTDWSASTEVTIIGVDPTPTPTNTPAPQPTNAPTSTPTPSKKPTPTPLKISPSSITPSVSSSSPRFLSSDSAVLGETREPTKAIVNPQSQRQQNLLAPFAFGGAGLSLASCGILLFLKKKRKNYDNNLQD